MVIAECYAPTNERHQMNGNTCKDCNEIVSDELFDSSTDQCAGCSDNFFTCRRCDTPHHDDYLGGWNRNELPLCQGCWDSHYTYCHSCAVGVSDIYFNTDADMCDRCASDAGTNCEYCGDWNHYDYLLANRSGENLCEYCYSGRNESLEGVRPYHAGAPWGLTFRDGNISKSAIPVAGVAYFGVEIEMEGSGGEDVSGIIYDCESHQDAHAEQDSSLDEGLELITQPATLAAWQGEFGQRIAGYVARLNAEGFTADSLHAGQHVHVSRGAFSDARHIARFASYFHLNKSHAVQISGRGRVASYAHLDGYGKGNLHSLAKNGRTSGSWGWNGNPRTSAVNLTNPNTIEIRLWGGTDDGTRTLGQVEFVAALMEYTRDLVISDVIAGALLADNFLTWLGLSENWERFPNAYALINARCDLTRVA